MSERILITNDDGIHAPGIAVLEKIARQLSDDVWIVAPEFEQSGKSHSLSLTEPLRVRKIDDKRFALQGTPTDCVIVACQKIMQDSPPTLLLSGINRGANLAEDMTYSGTIAAAIEGVIRGVRSIAMSQVFRSGNEVKWTTAEEHAPNILRRLIETELDPGVFININFPDVDPGNVGGAVATKVGQRAAFEILVHERIDARNFPYYWLSFKHDNSNANEETDLHAIARGMISVTPLHFDFTHHATHARLSKLLT